jgi:hypothetical protein
MPQPITLNLAIEELRLDILGKEGWLERFGPGSKKPRPEHEIAAKERRLEAFYAIRDWMERKAAA